MSWGWETPTEYLRSLWVKDIKKMTIIEKQIIKEMKELEMIKEEIAALEYNESLDDTEVIFPFPMEGKFREEYIQNYLYFRKFRYVKLEDTLLIPPVEDAYDTFDYRLKNLKDVDIDELIEKCIYIFFRIFENFIIF